jgi:hypothetical protein
MRATGLACFAQVKKDPRGTVESVARRIGCADEAEYSLILQRSIGEGVPSPLIEPAARHAEETAHDGRIELSAMGFDEGVLQSDRLRLALIPHRSSHVSTITPKVSVKAWEVQPDPIVDGTSDSGHACFSQSFPSPSCFPRRKHRPIKVAFYGFAEIFGKGRVADVPGGMEHADIALSPRLSREYLRIMPAYSFSAFPFRVHGTC